MVESKLIYPNGTLVKLSMVTIGILSSQVFWSKKPPFFLMINEIGKGTPLDGVCEC
jgi:hypothetical protein